MERFSVIGYKVTSNDGVSITKHIDTHEWDNTSYGNTNIASNSSCIYIWCIKINCGNNIRLGISSGPKLTNQCCFARTKGYNYGYSACSGNKVSKGTKHLYGAAFSEGDIIKIKLDLVERELSFYKNNINQGVAYKHIKQGVNISYNLAVCIKRKNWSISLLDFKKYGQIIDQKEAETLMIKNKELMDKIEKLENDQKENEMIIQEMKQKIDELTMKTMDLSHYESWNHDDVFMWIMSLGSGRYKKYDEKLKKNLQIQKICGEDLKSLEGADIIDLGVVEFKDKKSLLSSIQKLVNYQNQQNYVKEGQ